jgi:transcriptional regulator EpsA
MRLGETESIAQSRLPPPCAGSSRAAASDYDGSFDIMDLEAIAFNLEASLRVHEPHHFFGWTQGLLQSLIRHEVLICALRKGETELSLVESFAPAHADPKLFADVYRQDAALLEKLVEEWAAQHFQPLLHDACNDEIFADSMLQRELKRSGAGKVIAHGTHDTSGRMVSFFIFACRANDANARQLRLVEMLVSFVHSAWVRSRLCLSLDSGDGKSQLASQDLLTLREQEVLRWVYLGKSNIEIGFILGISALTVKNHVQEILRRLDVQNRTQAVGKAFKLRILTC